MRYLDDLLAQRARLERYPDSVRPYIALANVFLEDRISPVEFETVYFSLFKRDETTWEPELFAVLNDLFLDLDRYEPDPRVRDRISAFIDESELSAVVRRAVEAVNGLI